MWFVAVLLVVLILAGFTVFFGPPYLPVLKRQTDAALDLLALKPGDTLLELGSGDGRVLVAAAKRGINVVGIELSPVLVIISWLATRRYHKHVRIIWGSYFRTPWPQADAIYTFMIARHMTKLDRHIGQWRTGRPVRLVSVAFVVPGKKPADVKDGVYLYNYR